MKRLTYVSIIFPLLLLLGACGGDGTDGQNSTSDNLNCQGIFYDMQTTVSGRRNIEVYNALGDGYVTFSGTISTPFETAPMNYEGYTNVPPFEGSIQSSSVGTFSIGVLDATGDNGSSMIIYDGRPTLGPPTVYGEFTCVWS